MKTQKFWNAALALGMCSLPAFPAMAQYSGYSTVGPVTGPGVVNIGGYYGSSYALGAGGIQPFYSPFLNPYGYPANGYQNNGYNGYNNGNGYNGYNGADNGSSYNNPNAAPYAYGDPYADPSVNPDAPTLLDPNSPNPSVAPAPRLVAAVRPRVLPRTSDSIDANITSSGKRLSLTWNGEPRAVNQITFALLDINKRPIQTRTITSPPASTSFVRTSRTAYYRITIEYVNGTTNTITSPF